MTEKIIDFLEKFPLYILDFIASTYEDENEDEILNSFMYECFKSK
jgi:hypothetical protein